jgi:hypothetical protein
VPQNDLNDTEKLTQGLQQEITLLEPWYKESIRLFNRPRLDGLTMNSPEEMINYLVSFVVDPNIETFIPGQPITRALKLIADDLKYFYYQAAMARPDNVSDIQLSNWFFGETLAGKLLINIRKICLEHENPNLKIIGRTNFLPNAMLKYAEKR